MIRRFTYQALPIRLMFGPGSLAKPSDEVEALGLTRVLVLCSPEQAETGTSWPAVWPCQPVRGATTSSLAGRGRWYDGPGRPAPQRGWWVGSAAGDGVAARLASSLSRSSEVVPGSVV
jgi:hypothetical protein